MWNETTFSAMSFAIAGFQVSCGTEGGLLKIKVIPADSLKSTQLYLSKMTTDSSAIELCIAKSVNSSTGDASNSLNPSSIHQSINPKLQDKLTSLENTIKQLEEKIMARSESRRELKKSSSSEGRFSANGSRSNLAVLPSMAIRENEQAQFSEIIQEEVEQNAKLQLLNDLLQEKILDKEAACLELEKRLGQRQDLIRELADKLIIANIEKEDIFNQYEKILQNNVFHRMEESPSKPREQPNPQHPHKHETLIEEPQAYDEESTEAQNQPEINQQTKEEPRVAVEDEVTCG